MVVNNKYYLKQANIERTLSLTKNTNKLKLIDHDRRVERQNKEQQMY